MTRTTISRRQMKAWVLTMEWSTGVNDVTLNVEAVRGLSGVSGAVVAFGIYPGQGRVHAANGRETGG